MEPTRNQRGVASETVSIEAAHSPLKRRLDQALMRCGGRDFDTLDDYRPFVTAVIVSSLDLAGPGAREAPSTHFSTLETFPTW